MPRSDRWANPRYFPLAVSRPDSHPALLEALRNCPDKSPQQFSTASLVGTARELILRVVGDEEYEIDIVDFCLDAATGMLRLSKSWTALDLDSNGAKA